MLDAFSRKAMGWALDDHLEARLAIEALDMALGARIPAPQTLIHTAERWHGDDTTVPVLAKGKTDIGATEALRPRCRAERQAAQPRCQFQRFRLLAFSRKCQEWERTFPTSHNQRARGFAFPTAAPAIFEMFSSIHRSANLSRPFT